MSDDKKKSGRYTHVKDLDLIELKAFLGLKYYRGMLGLSKHSTKELWSADGPPVFGATMSQNRFEFLNSKISFDDPDTRQERFLNDRFAAIRDIFEHFNDNCGKYVEPPEFIALDETLYAMRNRISIKQYNPNKVKQIATSTLL